MVTGRPTFQPLGTVAAKQGRVAGENMAGRLSHFRGALGTTVVKVFGLAAARTGLATEEAKREGFHVVGRSGGGTFSGILLRGRTLHHQSPGRFGERRLLGRKSSEARWLP